MLSFQVLIDILKPKSYVNSNADLIISGFSIDTRSIHPGNAFVALQGEHAHGVQFSSQAIKAGAVIVLTDAQPQDPNIPHLLVSDTLTALKKIAKYQRSKFKGKLVGVTGSAGKTSVKEALLFVLQKLGINAYASPRSFNNHIGVPLTLSNIPSNASVVISEMGMNKPGEIREHTQLCLPHIAVVTSVGPGHIEFFNSVNDIALEKISISGGVSSSGVVMLPRDSDYYDIMRFQANEIYNRKHISFGASKDADVRVTSYHVTAEHTLFVAASIKGEEFNYTLPTLNIVWVNNSLAILAILNELGCNVVDGAKCFQKMPLTAGRGQVHTLNYKGKDITLIDDAYNANPLSVKSSLRSLAQYPGRKIAVLGDMLELGKKSKAYHTEVGNLCKELAIDLVLTCGVETKHTYEQLSPNQQLSHVDKASDVLVTLDALIQDSDTILFKASNGVNVHEIPDQMLSAQIEKGE